MQAPWVCATFIETYPALQQIKSIVLIDDDFDDAELFRDAVAELNSGIAIQHYSNGKDAVALLKQSEQLPDLVFLDINLPSSSGWQCLTEMQKMVRLRDLPVIMFSTSSQQREKQIARDLGAVGFLTKPSGFGSLKTMLGRIINLPVDKIHEAFS